MEENRTLVANADAAENAATSKEEEKKPKVTIDIDPVEFSGEAETLFMNSKKLRERINAIFREIFVDYFDCSIQMNVGNSIDAVNQTVALGGIYVDLIFAEKDAPGFHALKRRVSEETKKAPLFDRLESVAGTLNARFYDIDPDVLEALSEFMPVIGTKKTISTDQWYRHISEDSNRKPMNYAPAWINIGGSPHVVITGFPIELMLKKIFGDMDDQKNKYDYSCVVKCTALDGDTIFQITRISYATVRKLYELVGINPDYTMPMYMNLMNYNPNGFGPNGFGPNGFMPNNTQA